MSSFIDGLKRIKLKKLQPGRIVKAALEGKLAEEAVRVYNNANPGEVPLNSESVATNAKGLVDSVKTAATRAEDAVKQYAQANHVSEAEAALILARRAAGGAAAGLTFASPAVQSALLIGAVVFVLFMVSKKG